MQHSYLDYCRRFALAGIATQFLQPACFEPGATNQGDPTSRSTSDADDSQDGDNDGDEADPTPSITDEGSSPCDIDPADPLCADSVPFPGNEACFERLETLPPSGMATPVSTVWWQTAVHRINQDDAEFSSTVVALREPHAGAFEYCGQTLHKLDRDGDQCIVQWMSGDIGYPDEAYREVRSARLSVDDDDPQTMTIHAQGFAHLGGIVGEDIADLYLEHLSLEADIEDLGSISVPRALRVPGPVEIVEPEDDTLPAEIDVLEWWPVEGNPSIYLSMVGFPGMESEESSGGLVVSCLLKNDGEFEIPQAWLDDFKQLEGPVSLTLMATNVNYVELSSEHALMAGTSTFHTRDLGFDEGGREQSEKLHRFFLERFMTASNTH